MLCEQASPQATPYFQLLEWQPQTVQETKLCSASTMTWEFTILGVPYWVLVYKGIPLFGVDIRGPLFRNPPNLWQVKITLCCRARVQLKTWMRRIDVFLFHVSGSGSTISLSWACLLVNPRRLTDPAPDGPRPAFNVAFLKSIGGSCTLPVVWLLRVRAVHLQYHLALMVPRRGTCAGIQIHLCQSQCVCVCVCAVSFNFLRQQQEAVAAATPTAALPLTRLREAKQPAEEK